MSTKCTCNNRPGTWHSIEQTWQGQMEAEMKLVHREQMRNQIIKLLQEHHQAWFSQSLNIGSGAFWANKAATTQTLINEIRGLK